jgi:hypothetical protein
MKRGNKGKKKSEIQGYLGPKEKELRESFLLQVANIPGGESINSPIFHR